MTNASGVLVVDKPSGPTSHDVVSSARRVYHTREVGHAGTLDPMATGVLVLMLGEACKLSAYLVTAEKTYLAEIRFGSSTDTLDANGEVQERRVLEPGWLELGRLEAALDQERARHEQVPPAVSAIQVGGVRAHRAARRGQPLELAPRNVRVSELELVSASDERVELRLRVSKGYYVRSLARDLGQQLGVPAHLSSLRRLSSGSFTLQDAVRWPLAEPAPLMDATSAALRALPHATLTEEGARKARAGQRLSDAHFETAPQGDEVTAWLTPSGTLVALGQRRDEGHRVVRGFRA